MTTENYKKLRPWAGKFEESRHGYVRATRTDMDRFSEVYQEVYGSPVTQSQKTCPRCIIKLFQRVAADYWGFEKSPAYKKLIKSEQGEENGEAGSND